jgi:hypothetical protein
LSAATLLTTVTALRPATALHTGATTVLHPTPLHAGTTTTMHPAPLHTRTATLHPHEIVISSVTTLSHHASATLHATLPTIVPGELLSSESHPPHLLPGAIIVDVIVAIIAIHSASATPSTLTNSPSGSTGPDASFSIPLPNHGRQILPANSRASGRADSVSDPAALAVGVINRQGEQRSNAHGQKYGFKLGHDVSPRIMVVCDARFQNHNCVACGV